MPNLISNSLSALLSQQRAIGTTAHNIANSQTEGYTRQRVDFATRTPQTLGFGTIGNGVQIDRIQRVYDQFVVAQIRSASSSLGQLDTFQNLSSQVDNILADSSNGVNVALGAFFTSLQELSDNPSSVPVRQVVLAEAGSLTARFNNASQQLDVLEDEVSQRIKSEVVEVNGFTRRIAELNEAIRDHTARGTQPNDLLDQRDQALKGLSELVNISAVEQRDGTLGVYLGSSEVLVSGTASYDLQAQRGEFNPFRTEVTLGFGNGNKVISGKVSGGSLGGALNFRTDILDVTRAKLGRIATGLATVFNQQHRNGQDLNGALGGDFFTQPQPDAILSINNTGSVNATATISDLAALEPTDLTLRYDGSTWNIYDRFEQPVTFTGAGTAAAPFVAGGVSIELTGVPATGDQILVRPTANALASIGTSITNPAQLATALPIRTTANAGNLGSAAISQGEVIDVNDLNLLTTSTITFIDANNYQINAGPAIAYTAGQAIDINGSRVTIEGAPQAGDSFTLEPNNNGIGDNRNALLLNGLETRGVFNNGIGNLQSAALDLLGEVAVKTRNAEINRDSQQILLDQNIARRESISGVNLDEEAANLLRFQQAYTAAAQAVNIARDIIDTLFNATR